MDYPHRLQVSRAPQAPTTQGTLNKDTGVWTPADPTVDNTVVYDDLADVQDIGLLLTRDPLGLAVYTPTDDILAFLANESLISGIQEGDSAQVTWEDQTTSTFTVVTINRLDGSLRLRGVGRG